MNAHSGTIGGLHKLDHVGFVGVTGAAYSGKSAYREVLVEIMAPQEKKSLILSADMSDVIRWGKKESRFKNEIEAEQPLMDKGFYLKDEITIPLLIEYLDFEFTKNPEICQVIMSGFPRTAKQSETVMQLFSKRVLIIHMNVDRHTSFKAWKKRLETAVQQRTDDAGGMEVFENRWTQYNEQTLPALQTANGAVLKLERDMPMHVRVDTTIRHLKGETSDKKACDHVLKTKPVKHDRWVRKAHNRLKDFTHPVHQTILKIEGRVPSPLVLDQIGIKMPETCRA